MSIKHNTANTVFIELAGISSILSHLINQTTNTSFITDEVAYHMALYVFRYELNIRCLWTTVPATTIGVVDLEAMVADIKIPIELKQFIIFHSSDIFDRIEVAVNELMDLFIPRQTWDILLVREHGPFTVEIVNDGDYRVYEWIQHQRTHKTKFASCYRETTLGL